MSSTSTTWLTDENSKAGSATAVTIDNGGNIVLGDNTVIGENAWENSHQDGNSNTVVGQLAGSAGTKTSASDNNSLYGYLAGHNLSTGYENLFFGSQSGFNITTGDSNSAFGPGALSGQFDPSIGHTIGEPALTITDKLEENCSFGSYNLFYLINGNRNVTMGFQTGQFIAAGSQVQNLDDCTLVGAKIRPSADGVTNEIVIGYNGRGGGSNTFTCGNSSITNLMVDSDDSCDLGKSDHRFDDIYATNGTIQTSDQRLKDSITDTPLGLDFINALRPVQFKWKDRDEISETEKDIKTSLKGTQTSTDVKRIVQSAKTFSRKHQGLLAQEVKTALDSKGINVDDFAGYVDANVKDNVDAISLRYNEFIGPIIKAIQELSEKVDNL